MNTPITPDGPDPEPAAPTPRYSVEPDTLYAEAAVVYAASDRAQLTALDTTANLFLTDTIEHLRLLNPSPENAYQHATLTETVDRYRRAADGETADAETPDSEAADAGTTDGETAAAEAADGVAAAPETADPEAAEGEAGTGAKDTNGEVAENSSDGDTEDSNDGTTDAEDDSTEAVAKKQPAGKTTVLPGFPRFRMDQTMYGWIHSVSHKDDIGELAAMLGTTIPRTYTHITTAMTLVHGLPKFRERCLAGEFTIEHVIAAAALCRDVAFSQLPVIDAYLSARRADITIETFKKSLAMRVAVVQPHEDRSKTAHERRRVDLTTHPDGTACVMISGAADELQAFYKRIRALARAIRTGNTAVFAGQIPAGAIIDDDRTIAALMADIITGTNPQVDIEIIAENLTTGETTTENIPLDIASVTTADEVTAAIDAAARTALAEKGIDVESPDIVFCDEGTPEAGKDTPEAGEKTTEMVADAPQSGENAADSSEETSELLAETSATTEAGAMVGTIIGETDDGRVRCSARVGVSLTGSGPWMGVQGAVNVTVPCMTLLDGADLPGTFDDGSPVPAEIARRIAGQCSTWARILTDPITGTPIDAKAFRYRIPASVRRTLVAKWRTCSAPGCTNPAETSEIDHVIPFDHDHPAQGGLSVFGNLHCLCKADHDVKTNRCLDIEATPDGMKYMFRHGITAMTYPGDNPISAENARLMKEHGYSGSGPPRHDPPDLRHPDSGLPGIGLSGAGEPSTGPSGAGVSATDVPRTGVPVTSVSDTGLPVTDASGTGLPGISEGDSGPPAKRKPAPPLNPWTSTVDSWAERDNHNQDTGGEGGWVWDPDTPPPF